MFDPCQVCNAPIIDGEMSNHIAWHKSIDVIQEYKITVSWTNDTEKMLANNLRKDLRDMSLVCPPMADNSFDVFVKTQDLDSIQRLINKKRGGCTTSVSAVDIVYPE